MYEPVVMDVGLGEMSCDLLTWPGVGQPLRIDKKPASGRVALGAERRSE